MEMITQLLNAGDLEVVGTNAMRRSKEFQYAAVAGVHQVGEACTMHADDVGGIAEQPDLLWEAELFKLNRGKAAALKVAGDLALIGDSSGCCPAATDEHPAWQAAGRTTAFYGSEPLGQLLEMDRRDRIKGCLRCVLMAVRSGGKQGVAADVGTAGAGTVREEASGGCPSRASDSICQVLSRSGTRSRTALPVCW